MRKSITTIAAILFSATFASAAVIDDFSTPVAGQTVTQTTIGNSPASTSVGPVANVIGGTRQVVVTISAITGGGAGNASAKINVPTAGAVEINSDSNTNGSELFSYGTTGDLNANLSNGGLSNAFVVRLLDTDLASTTNANSISVTTTGGGSGTANFMIPALVGEVGGLVAPFDVVIPFTSFSGAPDFANIDTIGLTINGPASSDYTLDFFATNAVPEPASLGIIGAGALGFFARRKR